MSATPLSSRGGSASAQAAGGSFTSSLRALLDQRRTEGGFLSLDEAIAIVVPLCLDLKERHGRGERLYVHPSSIGRGQDGLACLVPRLSLVPIQPRDRACIAPELQSTLEPGTQKASVFSVGACLYEMLTGYSIGPAMRRPLEVNPSLPEAIELLLSKALVGDPQHRPDDLGALASALHHLAPMKSIVPPEVDESNLDRTGDYDAVDVRMSLLPPHEIINVTIPPMNMSGTSMPDLPPMGGASAAAMAHMQNPQAHQANHAQNQEAPMSNRDPAVRLIQLKARLESDPRPRYTVHKNRMDHGPFSAVELLQQIANNTFRPEDGIRDELSGQDRPIKDWEEFAPFAEQASLHRQLAAEKVEVKAAIQAEKKSGVAKAVISGGVVVALLVGVSVWFFEQRGSRRDGVDIADDPTALDISIDGGAKVVMKRGVTGGGAGGKAPSGYAPSGQSYQAALASNVQQVTIGQKGGADLSDAQLAGPFRNAGFINGCGAPDSMHVTIQVAVKSGRAVGVSVSTDPPNGGVASCVDRAVRGMSWPSSPNMDSMTTRF